MSETVDEAIDRIAATLHMEDLRVVSHNAVELVDLLCDRVAELEEALRPFAEGADICSGGLDAEWEGRWAQVLSARRLLGMEVEP